MKKDKMTMAEVCAWLKVGPKLVLKLIRTDGMHATKTGGRWTFERGDLEAWWRGKLNQTVNEARERRAARERREAQS